MTNIPVPPVAGVAERLAEAISDRFRIEREAGRGGMATVYLARDLKHDRQVALKVLRPELAAVLGTERFLQEIRITARLSHPHILPLLDSGTAAGFLFYAMPWVQGESLRQRLEREAQLPLDSALSLARQVSSALGCAHEQGIVHRDIKPENILLHGGEAVVADFGIAFALRAAAGARLTETGLSLGTPQYMSPEQASGDGSVDARCDVYALGAVLYEMLVGEPPFTGATPGIVLAKLLTAEPIEPRVLRRSIPEHVNRAVLKALAKLPGDRFATIAEFARALAEPADIPAAGSSIVVLPFENLSPDPDNAFFADGLTEELITDLSAVRSLRVISRTSAVACCRGGRNATEIARELNVRYVLSGSVRRAASSLRITAKLVDAVEDRQLWAEKYGGTLDDVFAIQEQVSAAIVAALRLAITPEESRALARRPISDPRAHDSYLRARYEIWQFSKNGLDRARRHIANAEAIVGENALLATTLGHIHIMYLEAGIDPDPAHLAEAAACAERAFRLEPESARAHWISGHVHFTRGELSQALAAFERARRAAPDEPDMLLMLGYMCALVGRNRDAAACFGRALVVDPLLPLNHCMSGFLAVLEGRFQDALEPYRRFYEMDVDNPFAHWCVAWVLAWNGKLDEAEAFAASMVERFPGEVMTALGQSLMLGLRGRHAEALAAITPACEAAARQTEMLTRELCHCYAVAGHTAKALEWFERTVVRMRNYEFLARHDVFLDNIRHEAGFQDILRRVAP